MNAIVADLEAIAIASASAIVTATENATANEIASVIEHTAANESQVVVENETLQLSPSVTTDGLKLEKAVRALEGPKQCTLHIRVILKITRNTATPATSARDRTASKRTTRAMAGKETVEATHLAALSARDRTGTTITTRTMTMILMTTQTRTTPTILQTLANAAMTPAATATATFATSSPKASAPHASAGGAAVAGADAKQSNTMLAGLDILSLPLSQNLLLRGNNRVNNDGSHIKHYHKAEQSNDYGCSADCAQQHHQSLPVAPEHFSRRQKSRSTNSSAPVGTREAHEQKKKEEEEKEKPTRSNA
mmetsp:Transcript_9662/g.25774  ORF Transcript_9662/g.25774 Transcript_9662/m.25774 type:complete len:308 (+) Transcript_9662:173-1096(+)